MIVIGCFSCACAVDVDFDFDVEKEDRSSEGRDNCAWKVSVI